MGRDGTVYDRCKLHLTSSVFYSLSLGTHPPNPIFPFKPKNSGHFIKQKELAATFKETQTIWFFYLLLPLDWNDFSSVCSKPDLKSGPRGNGKVDPLSCSVVVCFFLHVISHF